METNAEKEFRPFIVDVEASGFGSLSYPIEVGVAMDDNHRYCSLIHPPPQWTHWDKKAETLHHISREILLRHGKSPPRVALELNNLLEDLTVYTDGWSVDKPWITLLFAQAGLRPSFTVSPLERILTEEQMLSWQATKDKIIKTMNQSRHRASIDAYIIQETFVQTRNGQKQSGRKPS